MTHRPLLLLTIAVLSAAPTFAQTGPANAATSSRDQAPPPPVDEGSQARTGTAEAYRDNGGSLLRAGRGVAITAGTGAAPGPTVDPRVADMSFWAVPPQQRRVIRPHTLVTLIVKEQSEFKSDGKTTLDKKADLEAELSQFIKLNLSNLAVGNGVGAVKPKIDVSGSRSFSGDGKAERKDSFSVRMQAEVVDVKPNGNLVLQARRRLKNDDEERVYLVSGIARVEDVTTDNTILSTQLYDFDLSQTSKGTVREATKRGWLPRLLDAINPF